MGWPRKHARAKRREHKPPPRKTIERTTLGPAIYATDTSDPFPLGSVIADKYRLGYVIGRGGMGVAYLAEHLDTGQAVCVKVMHRAHVQHLGVWEYVRFEAGCLRRLRHPHIVELVDEIIWDGLHCLVTGYVPGRPLHHEYFWSKERLSITQKVDIGAQVLSALMAATKAGIVHRDVTHNNVVAYPGRRIRAVLLDFGVARERRSDVMVELSGSPPCASPQQIEGCDANPLDDQYALGIFLYRLCAGTHPSDGNGPYAWSKGQSYLDAWRQGLVGFTPILERVPKLPARLARAITTMISFRREDRFAAWEDVARALLPHASPWQRRAFEKRHKAELSTSKPAPLVPAPPLPAVAPLPVLDYTGANVLLACAFRGFSRSRATHLLPTT